MKICYCFVFIGTLFFTQLACSKDDDSDVVPKGTWRKEYMDQKYSFCCEDGVAFAVQDTLFVGFGTFDAMDEVSPYFLRYVLNGEQIGGEMVDAFPGKPRRGAVAFVIGSKAYVGLGYTMNEKKEVICYDDFWVFDIKTESWEPEPLVFKFPGNARRDAVAFTLDGKGYVGTGDNGKDIFNDYSDMYSFEPEVGWKAFLPLNTPITGAVAFVADGNAYICTGGRFYDKAWNNWLFRGMYKLSPGAAEWSFMKPLEGKTAEVARRYASAFVLNVKGEDYVYLVSGVDALRTELFSCWGYNPRKDEWRRMADLPKFMKNGIGTSTRGNGYILGDPIYMQIFSLQ